MKSCRNGVNVSHLLFADNSLLFCPATPIECTCLLNILAAYEQASGQAINWQKMALFFNPNTKPGVREDIRAMFDAQVVTKFEKYLGLLMVGAKNKVSTFKDLQERIAKWVTGWKEKFISKAGRLVALRVLPPSTGDHSNAIADGKLWKVVWPPNAPPKVRTFLWWACSNILPTRDNLHTKRVHVASTCSVCNQQAEIGVHILWECPFARNVWALVKGKIQKSSAVVPDFFLLTRSML